MDYQGEFINACFIDVSTHFHTCMHSIEMCVASYRDIPSQESSLQLKVGFCLSASVFIIFSNFVLNS